MKRICAIFVLVAVFVTAGCARMSYYGHVIKGQLSVLSGREPITELLRNPEIDPKQKALFEKVLAVRAFAVTDLGLPDNASYRKFKDVGRPYVVWNVVAAPKASLSLVQSCFPFAGCVVYQGFFNEQRALKKAADLQEAGLETYVYGVRAYSTLGWFDDPLLNTMVDGVGESYWIELIFHELVHQAVYLPGDSQFNEAFATAFAELGLQAWHAAQGESTRHDAQANERQKQFDAMILNYRQRLETLYATAFDEEAKATIYADLLQAYEQLKTTWDGYSGYDRWMSDQMNNAKLGIFSTYREEVEVIKTAITACELPLKTFIVRAADQITDLNDITTIRKGACPF